MRTPSEKSSILETDKLARNFFRFLLVRRAAAA